MSTKISEISTLQYSAGEKIITFNEPLIMAIVNVTPDSFYDGGKYGASEDVIRDVREKITAGAHIIDIGASSTRPGAAEISVEEEKRRLHNILPLLRKEFPKVLISVDTYRSEIARWSAGNGADIINDIGGGDLDPLMFNTIAELNLPYILMHIQGKPSTMQQDPQYQDVTMEVTEHLAARAAQLKKLGFEKIILDPGFGFGKKLQHNYALLASLHQVVELGYPVLAGLSRKGMINQVLGTNPVTALNGTTVLNTLALQQGAHILRVHDVTEARQVIKLTKVYNHAKQ